MFIVIKTTPKTSGHRAGFSLSAKESCQTIDIPLAVCGWRHSENLLCLEKRLLAFGKKLAFPSVSYMQVMAPR